MREILKCFSDKRFRKIIFLFISFAGQFWWLNKIKKFISKEKLDLKYKGIYKSQAVAFTETATDLGGLLIKIGQFLSSRVDILPEEYTSELSKLQDAVKPVETDKVILQIEEEFGKKLGDVFTYFSKEPIASASLGQVYVAEILNNKKVAVKVLRPGIAQIINIDLEALKVVMSFAKRYPRISEAVDLDQLYKEFVETTLDELDYLKEGRNADAFRLNFSGDKKIYIPEIYWDYTSEKVLTMEYITGYKINDLSALEKAGLNSTVIAETLLLSYLKQLLTDSFFHADPHPGNLLIKEDGTLVFLDFGMVGRIDKSMKDNMVALVLNVFKKDANGVISNFDDLGFLRPHANKATLVKGMELIMANLFDDNNDFKNVNLEELSLEIREFMYSQPFQLPAQTLFLGKALLTIAGICNGLDSKLDYIKLLRPYAEDILSGSSTGTKTNIILDQAKKIFADVISLPEKVNRLVKGLELGEIKMQPSKVFEKALYQHQYQQSNRIIKAVLSSGCMITGAIFLNGPLFNVGIAFLVVAAILFATLFSGGRSPSYRKPRFHNLGS